MASFPGTANGWTVDYGLRVVARKHVTFLNSKQIADLSQINVQFVAGTLWHEVEGHNINGEDDSEAFDKKYDEAVDAAINALRVQKIDQVLCKPTKGAPWTMKNAFDKILCDCDISWRPQP